MQTVSLPQYRVHSPPPRGKLVHPNGHTCLLVTLTSSCCDPGAGQMATGKTQEKHSTSGGSVQLSCSSGCLEAPGAFLTQLGGVDLPCQVYLSHTGSIGHLSMPIQERGKGWLGHGPHMIGFPWGVHAAQPFTRGHLLVSLRS